MAHSPIAFIRDLTLSDLPDDVVRQARRCLIDLVGVGAAGSTTELSRIIRNHAVRQFGPGEAGASLLFDGRKASPAGATLANAMTIDAFDAHDGHPLIKGHVGCSVVPALLACCEAEDQRDAAEFLAALVIGYEIGTRAGMALHGTVVDYHTSGAWGALACAAVAGRVLGLDHGQLREALGVAEYHGPRSQMMRCIDHPTMVKDGSGWGGMAGVSAAYLAKDGFTGAPAITMEAPDVAEIWSDLGSRWRIMEQYFKPYPVCRWAQPAIEAALQVMREHKVEPGAIESLEVTSFHEAARLAVREPATTEAAQYSLPFPVAAAVVRGTIGAEELLPNGLADPEILHISRLMTLSESADYNAAFPAERWAHVTIGLDDGRVLTSRPAVPRGNAESPLSAREISDKFHANAGPLIGLERSSAIRDLVEAFGRGASLRDLLKAIGKPAAEGYDTQLRQAV